MKLTYKIIAGAAVALSLAVAGIVHAHPGGGMGWGMGPGMGPGMGMGFGMGPGAGPGMRGGMGTGMGGWMGGADAAAVAAGQAAQLKAALKITPAQEASWKKFEAALQQQASAMQSLRAQMQAWMDSQRPGADSAGFAAQRDAMIKQHDASRAARSDAFKELYAALTPEQRAIADSGMGPMAGGRMGRWHPMR